MPTLALLHERVDAKAADPGRRMAKLHSLVRSKSATCLSLMIERASA
jgi:hypothetical protein